MATKKVPKATLQRYPLYLKALRRLKKNGVQRIMSKENSVIFFGFQTDHESHKYLKIICVAWGALPKRIFRWKK